MVAAARVALVGFGLGGSVFHAPLIEATAGLELRAIVTSDPGRRESAQRRYPRAAIVEGIDQIVHSPADWDLVVVTTPNSSHLGLALAAVDAGIHVVVDKPITPTSAEAGRLARLARRRGVTVIPYHNRRWDGDFMTVRDLVRTGQLGQVWRFESRFERWKPGPPRPGSWKSDPDQPGGGILYDLGTHLVDQALHLFGLPAAVYAEQAGHGSPLDDDTFVALHYAQGGPAVHLWASTSAAQWGPRFRVLGSEAAYVKFGMDPQEEALKAGSVPGAPGWGEDRPEEWGRLGVLAEATPVTTRAGAYEEFYRGVARHLLEDEPPPVDVGDAIDGLKVLEAAAESARSGRVVPL